MFNEDTDDETAHVTTDIYIPDTPRAWDNDILNAAPFQIPTTPDADKVITDILSSTNGEEESVWQERTPHSRVILEVNSVDGYIDLHTRVNNLKKTKIQLFRDDDFDDSCTSETASVDDEDDFDHKSEASWDDEFI
jgi:hypothetical protein